MNNNEYKIIGAYPHTDKKGNPIYLYFVLSNADDKGMCRAFPVFDKRIYNLGDTVVVYFINGYHHIIKLVTPKGD